eukprot:scaffold82957_cov16-Tisochrysis_lutea.AAC.2
MVPWLNDHDLRTPDLAAFHAAPEAMLQLRGSDSHSHAGELYAPAFRCTVQKRATCTTACTMQGRDIRESKCLCS